VPSTTSSARLPGPRALTPLGQLLPMRRDVIGFLSRLAAEYGDVAGFTIGGIPVVLLGHPDQVRDVLQTNHRNFVKGRPLHLAKQLLGQGLLTSEGDFHQRQSRRVQPAFQADRIRAYGAVMTGYAARLSDGWHDGATRDMMREMTSLARVQERELRAWLYGRAPTLAGTRLRDAVDAMVGRIERDERVRVEAVVVGDVELDEHVRALVSAIGEATLNAARHSGAAVVSVFVEVEGEAINAYVRDGGTGFDMTAVATDRRGIADSIIGRLERHGGTARVASRPGSGTEVVLHLPRRPT